MHIILLQDYDQLGKAGEQFEVKDGYARNFLVPRGFALRATPNNIKRFQEQARLGNLKKDRALKQSRELAE